MAKADDTSSTIDWIRLCEALDLAAERLWSRELAKKRLLELLAAGKVPWCCMSWKGLDAKSLAEMRRTGTDSKGATVANLPSAAHCPGDPGFWNSNLKIDWEDNGAREVRSHGAVALGIKVSRKHLLALLPARSSKHEEHRQGPQARRVPPALKTLYPPNGEVPDTVSTEAVRGQVNKELADETRIKGLREISWDTMNRILDREK